MKTIERLGSASTFIIMLAACGQPVAQSTGGKLVIVATTGLIADVAGQVAAEIGYPA